MRVIYARASTARLHVSALFCMAGAALTLTNIKESSCKGFTGQGENADRRDEPGDR